MNDAPLVSYTVTGHVATIRLERAKAMNAMNHDLRLALRAAQADAEADGDVRVIVLTGSGNSFTSGTDLKELGDFATKKGMFDISVRDYKPILDGIARSEKLYIAAINGVAGGVGLSVALTCDLAIMAQSATCFAPFTNIGLVPDGGLSWLLLQHMGSKRALEMIAEAQHLDAARCLELGLVNRLAADADLLQAAQDWAASLAERAPLSLSYAKQIMRAAHTQSHEQIALMESEYQMKCANSEDSGNAIAAFLTKQKPVFKGR